MHNIFRLAVGLQPLYAVGVLPLFFTLLLISMPIGLVEIYSLYIVKMAIEGKVFDDFVITVFEDNLEPIVYGVILLICSSCVRFCFQVTSYWFSYRTSVLLVIKLIKKFKENAERGILDSSNELVNVCVVESEIYCTRFLPSILNLSQNISTLVILSLFLGWQLTLTASFVISIVLILALAVLLFGAQRRLGALRVDKNARKIEAVTSISQMQYFFKNTMGSSLTLEKTRSVLSQLARVQMLSASTSSVPKLGLDVILAVVLISFFLVKDNGDLEEFSWILIVLFRILPIVGQVIQGFGGVFLGLGAAKGVTRALD